MSHRSINEILSEIDENSSMKDIREASKEVFQNKKRYPLEQLEFCNEYLNEMMIAASNKLDKCREYET